MSEKAPQLEFSAPDEDISELALSLEESREADAQESQEPSNETIDRFAEIYQKASEMYEMIASMENELVVLADKAGEKYVPAFKIVPVDSNSTETEDAKNTPLSNNTQRLLSGYKASSLKRPLAINMGQVILQPSSDKDKSAEKAFSSAAPDKRAHRRVSTDVIHSDAVHLDGPKPSMTHENRPKSREADSIADIKALFDAAEAEPENQPSKFKVPSPKELMDMVRRKSEPAEPVTEIESEAVATAEVPVPAFGTAPTEAEASEPVVEDVLTVPDEEIKTEVNEPNVRKPLAPVFADRHVRADKDQASGNENNTRTPRTIGQPPTSYVPRTPFEASRPVSKEVEIYKGGEKPEDAKKWFKSAREKYGLHFWNAKWGAAKDFLTERVFGRAYNSKYFLNAGVNESMSDEEKQKKQDRNRTIMLIGVGVVGGAIVGSLVTAGIINAQHHSGDALANVSTGGSGGGGTKEIIPSDIKDTLNGNGAQSGAGEITPPAPAAPVFEPYTNDAYIIPDGGEGLKLFSKLGLSTDVWNAHQAELARLFPDDFYPAAGGAGLNKEGWLSEEAQKYIENIRQIGG